MRWTARAAAWLLASGLAAGCGNSGGLTVRDAHVVPPPGGQGPAGGFAVLANGSGRERALLGASSPVCHRVELHRSWTDGDVARMAPVARVAIPDGGELRLEPGAHHLMLFDCVLEGEHVTLELQLDGGETRTVRASLRAAGGHEHDHP